MMGDDCDSRHAIRLLTNCSAPGTYANAGGKWRQFQLFCSARNLDSLPATPEICLRYGGYLARKRKKNGMPAVNARSAQQYFSAINRVHAEVLGSPVGFPAGGPMFQRLKSGWERDHIQKFPELVKDATTALPADVACKALAGADEALLPLKHGLVRHSSRLHTAQSRQTAVLKDVKLNQSKLNNLRSDVAIAFEFLLCGRADTAAYLSLNDVSVTDDYITARVREKGKKHQRERNVTQFPVQGLDTIARVLRRWRRLIIALKVNHPADPGSFWRLPGERDRAFTSTDVTAWLTDVCARYRCSPPPGHKWTSHSLRKGSVSAAVAAGMYYQLGTIRCTIRCTIS